MAGITERNQQKQELMQTGFSMQYIDEWQPKTTLFRHKESYNTNGEVDSEVGTTVKNVPGNPDYVLKKAKIGLYPWPPSEACTCKWCASNRVEVPESKDETIAVPDVVPEEPIDPTKILRRSTRQSTARTKPS